MTKSDELAALVERAAIQWCGEKDRETFQSDVEYFKANWWAFPGFRNRVEALKRMEQGNDRI